MLRFYFHPQAGLPFYMTSGRSIQLRPFFLPPAGCPAGPSSHSRI